MKKVLIFTMIFTFSLVLVSCSGDSGSQPKSVANTNSANKNSANTGAAKPAAVQPSPAADGKSDADKSANRMDDGKSDADKSNSNR